VVAGVVGSSPARLLYARQLVSEHLLLVHEALLLPLELSDPSHHEPEATEGAEERKYPPDGREHDLEDWCRKSR